MCTSIRVSKRIKICLLITDTATNTSCQRRSQIMLYVADGLKVYYVRKPVTK